MKGLCVGLVTGMVAGAAGVLYIRKNKRGIKRNAGRALHSIGDLMESVTAMF